MQDLKVYFVTGATGAVGSALVPLLLGDPNVKVFLLLRAGSSEELSSRLQTLFQFWCFAENDDALKSRVVGLRGDVTAPCFGLADSEYADLVESCTHIVHSAGNVRMNLPIEEARRCAVDSARNIVSLARDCSERGGLQKVEFVSTVGVGGRLTSVPERWITEQRGFHNTYEQSKAEAEDFLREQIEKYDLPVTVHRPSMVVGDSKSGKIIHFQIFYYLSEFLAGRQTVGVVPIIKDTQLDTIPVDYVAKALYWSSTQKSCIGQILHLCSGSEKALTITSLTLVLREVLITRGEKLPGLYQMPVNLFQGLLPLIKLFVSERARKAIGNLSLYLDYAGGCQTFDNDKTNDLLSNAAKLEIPAPKQYMDNIMKAYLESKRSR